jgi:hypothetical protein
MQESKPLLRALTLILPLIVLLSGISKADCHVVLPEGSGDLSGSDWNNALAGLPSSLVRGDIYYLAGGSYDRHTFNDPDNGDQLIEIRAATGGDHCSSIGWDSSTMVGQATFTCSSNCTAILNFNTGFYIVDGQYCTPLAGAAVCTSGFGFKVDNSNGNAAVDIQGGLGYKGPPAFDHDITVKYVEVSGAHPVDDSSTLDLGFDFEGGSYNLLFDHIYVHDDYVPFFLRGNHNLQEGFGSGNNLTIQNSYWAHNYNSPANHSEGCSCSEGLTNFTIRNNYIVDMIGTSYVATPSGAGYGNGNGNNGPWFIYGNVFMATSEGISDLHCGTGDGMFAAWDTTFTGDVYFVNNTIANFYGCQADNNGFGLGLGYITPMQYVYSYNNLIWNTDVVTVINTGITTWDGALFAGTDWSYNAWFQIPDSSASNDTDPNKQVSSSNPFVDSGSYNWNLAAHTDAGMSTHSILPENDLDMNGVRRGSSGIWDRGAFQIPGVGPTAIPGLIPFWGRTLMRLEAGGRSN